MAASYTADFEVLRLSASMSPDRARLTDLLQNESLDWSWITDAAVFHRVHPLVHRTLQDVHSSDVPQPVHAQLSEIIHAAMARTLFGLDELSRVLDRFSRAGVPALVFKGPILSWLAYGDERLRDSADLDVLISPQDIETVDDLLCHGHYRRLNSDSSPMHRRIRFFFEKEHHYARGELTFNLDVHTAAVKPSLGTWVSFRTLHERSQSVQVGGFSFRTPSNEDLLQLLCYHGTKDRWMRLRRICDISGLIRRHPDIKWNITLARAQALRCERILCLGVYLAHRVLDLHLPESILHFVDRHSSMTAWGDLLAARLSQRDDEQAWGSLRERIAYPLAVQDTLGRKMRYATYAGLGKLVSSVA